MTQKRLCPKCGAELSPDAAQGLCPKCLLDTGLESLAADTAGNAATGPFVTPSPSAATIPPSARFPTPYLETLARQFPQLEILELLGQGGMGVVYKARQRQLNRLVAVKILPPSVGEDPAFAERFTREAQALARLNHPHIVQVHDFGQTEEFFYFVMEFVDGANLRALIHDGNLKAEEALKIVPQICEALQFAHEEGIVHRDIKPENILIDKKGRVKIADFGLAKLLGQAAEDLSLTGTGQLMGTLGYMAPEQLQGAHGVDHRADIYSLGVVFYEMLTGQLPIGRFEPPSKKVQVDVRLDEVVLRSLESEPDRRYQHASEVRTDLETISGSPQAWAPMARPGAGAPADDAEETERRKQLASRAPAWVHLAALGTFIAAWLVFGALWNLRDPGVVLGIGVLAASVYYVLRLKLRYLPALRAELSRQSRLRRAFALACGLAMFSLAVLAATGLQQSLATGTSESTRQNWLSGPPRSAFLLDKLNALRGENTSELLVLPIGGHSSGLSQSWAADAINAIWVLVLFPCSVASVISTRLWGNTWKYSWGPSLSLTFGLIVALGVANVIRVSHVRIDGKSLSIVSTQTRSSFPAREIRAAIPVASLDRIRNDWAKANGYVAGSHFSWRIAKKPGDKTIGRVLMAELRPASAFYSWRLAWGAAAWRPLPPLNITCVSTDNPAESFVSADAGFISKDSPEEKTWPAILDSLEEAIHTGSPVVSSVIQRELHPDTTWILGVFCGGIALAFVTAVGFAGYRELQRKNAISVQQPRESSTSPSSAETFVRQRVSRVANILLAVAILGLTSLCLATLIAFTIFAQAKISATSSDAVRSGTIGLDPAQWFVFFSLVGVGLARNSLLIFGALRMKHLQSYRLAMASSVLAVIPNTSVILISWAIIAALNWGMIR